MLIDPTIKPEGGFTNFTLKDQIVKAFFEC